MISNIFKTKNVSKNVIELFNFFYKTILKIPKESNFICKSSDAYVNPSTVLSIQNRFKETLTKKCPWSKKEVDLLKRLMRDIGGNCTQLSNYFEKRSVNSIRNKTMNLFKKKEVLLKPFLL